MWLSLRFISLNLLRNFLKFLPSITRDSWAPAIGLSQHSYVKTTYWFQKMLEAVQQFIYIFFILEGKYPQDLLFALVFKIFLKCGVIKSMVKKKKKKSTVYRIKYHREFEQENSWKTLQDLENRRYLVPFVWDISKSKV